MTHSTSEISADESHAYDALRDFYAVGRINHSAKEYSRNGINTNQIEGFWSRVKRTNIVTHHWSSRKHTQLYLNGCAFRENVGRDDDALTLPPIHRTGACEDLLKKQKGTPLNLG